MKHMITRSTLIAAALLAATGSSAQVTNVAVNNSGAGAAPTAILDIASTFAGTQKGFLIPRMTQAQRTAIAAGVAQDGLTVYQTDGSRGFYYYDGAAWQYMYGTGDPWNLLGNTGTNVATNFLGTTDNQPLIFRTNAVERMRLDVQGDLGVGQVNPQEKLEVAGAIKLTGTSATTGAGTMRWNGAVPTNMYHEGNIDGTALGWRKLENDYLEVFGAAYSQPSPVTCAAGSAVIGPWTTYYTPGPPAPLSNNQIVSPWTHGNFARSRHQYLFRLNELDLELNQLFNNPNATMGLCAGQPINSISFWVNTNIAAAQQKAYAWRILIKHSTLTTLTGFDNTADPAAQCALSNDAVNGTAALADGSPQNEPALGAPGWRTFNFPTPFVWNGVDGLIVEFCYSTTTTNVAQPFVWCTPAMSGWNPSYSRYGAASGTCVTNGACGAVNIAGCGMDNVCGSGGSNTQRPVIQFSGVTGTAAPAIVGAGKYITYNGGFIVQQTPYTYAAQTVPYYGYRGPGTISAQSGVYDDQTRLNDHVFDRYFDGRVHPADAPVFGTQRHLGIGEMVNYVERERHLPTMKGREVWERQGGFGLGDLGNQLWATTETQALYLTELNDRMDVLRMLSTNEPIGAKDMVKVREAICSMNDLNEAEKDRLIRACQQRTATTEQAR